MNYTRQAFYNLMEAVEDQGGVHLDKTCKPKTHSFKIRGAVKAVILPTCGKSALFEVPYLDDPGEKVEVCAVEDDMGLWPRFADQVSG